MGASLFTNASAQTALQTLSAASKSLSATQNRVSTGYRINTAEDNAAYWSIATTLRSDVKALGAVGDALGLGAATVDTVYTGINDTKDLLDQIKSKLVTASQSGVPRAQVQAEITQLQNRLKDVSKSTVINSESWLTQDSSAAGYNSTKNVVGSFTRTGGAISIDNIEIDISGTKLYENSASAHEAVKTSLETSGTGALAVYEQALKDVADVTNTDDTDWAAQLKAAALTNAASAGMLIAPAATNVADGAVVGTAVNTSAAAVHTLTATELDTALGLMATSLGANGGTDFIASLSSTQKSNLLVELNDIGTKFKNSLTEIGTAAGTDPIGADGFAKVEVAKATFEAETLKAFDKVIGTPARDTFVAKTAANARDVSNASLMGDVANQKLGIFDKVRTVVSGKDGSEGRAISVANIDISKLTDTDFDKGILTSYLKATDDALQELTLSAAVVGAAKARIEGNKTFVKNLVDANNRGIGQLVDADLNEESAKLKALQTQEQLAIQALGIANSSSQNILRLFQ